MRFDAASTHPASSARIRSESGVLSQAMPRAKSFDRSPAAWDTFLLG